MTATMNAGGGDWLDLPTQPIQHRGARKAEGLPWDRITEEYVARGGQVDAGVWPEARGKVRIITDRNHIHTIEEHTGDYDNTLSQGAPKPKPASRALLTAADQRKVALRYRQGENIRELGVAFGVSITAIRTALKAQGEQFRTRSEAQQLRRA